jgi:hypothetical protein
MSQPINRYKADLRDFRFVLFEQFKLHELLGKGPFANWGKEEVETVIDEVYAWSTKVLGPLNAVGDAEGCKLVNGQVITPPGFKEAWKSLVQARAHRSRWPASPTRSCAAPTSPSTCTRA